MLETTLTGAIKQWYTSSGIANLKKSDADHTDYRGKITQQGR